MTRKIEIEIVKNETAEQKDENKFQTLKVDLNSLCSTNKLNWFSFKECFTCHQTENNCDCSAQKADLRVVYFMHERGETTGAKFSRKTDMAETAMLFHATRLTWPNANFVLWAGRRGCRLLTAMSPEKRAEVRAAKAFLEAMKEASAAGSHANVKAGVAPVSEVVS